jgi:hypothetical protein
MTDLNAYTIRQEGASYWVYKGETKMTRHNSRAAAQNYIRLQERNRGSRSKQELEHRWFR